MRWPLVGRERELGLIRQLSRDPDCCGVLLAGPGGVGKTRLSRELIEGCGLSSGRPAWIAATRSTRSISFGALAHLLADARPAITDRLELLRYGQQVLADLAGNAGGMLLIDDTHLLDDLSAAVVQQLLSARSVFAVLTVRAEEDLPEPLRRIRDSGLLTRLDVGPLDREGVYELSEAVLGSWIEGRTRHHLWRLSQGNPLFLRELILGARDHGILREEQGVWRHSGSLAGFGALRDVIDARLELLDDREREALEVLALTEPVGVQLLELAIGAEALEELERHQFAEVWHDGQRLLVRTGHPIYTETIAETMPRLRARRILREVAELLESNGCRRRDDLFRLATWRLETSTPCDPEVLIQAGRQAQTVFDHGLAERLARSARDQGGGAEASLLLAETLAAQGRIDEAERLMARIESSADHDEDRVAATLARANLLTFQRGDAQVLRLLERAASEVASSAHRDDLEAMLVFAAAYLGDLPRAVEEGREFLDRQDPAPQATALVRVLVVYTYARALMADYAGLGEEIERGRQLAQADPDAFPLAGHLLVANQGLALRGSGQLLAAERLVRRFHEHAIIEDATDAQALWAIQVAHTLDLRGHLEDALRLYDEGLAALAEHDPVGMRALSLALASTAAAVLGQRRRARELLADYHGQVSGRTPAFGTVWEARARAWLSYLDGDLPRAAELAVDAGRIGVREHLWLFAALALHDAIRLGYPEPATDELQHLEQETGGDLIPLLAEHGRALSASDAERVEAVSVRFERLGADLYAAESAAQAAYLSAQAEPAAGSLHLRARAGLLAERCSNVDTPWLWQQRPEELTAREYQVAMIAARGHTNQEISERLGISPRTVGNHLASTYSKLGVGGRADIAALLGIAAD